MHFVGKMQRINATLKRKLTHEVENEDESLQDGQNELHTFTIKTQHISPKLVFELSLTRLRQIKQNKNRHTIEKQRKIPEKRKQKSQTPFLINKKNEILFSIQQNLNRFLLFCYLLSSD